MSAEEVGGEQEDIIDVNAIQLDVTPTAGAGQQALVPFDKLPDEEKDKAFAAVELAVMSGDYGQLSPQASFALVRRRCEALQVDITQGPFVWGKDRKGKKMLIPVKNLYQQLRANRDIKLEVEEERVDAELGIYYLRIKASMGNNRTDTDISAVSIKNPDGSFMNPEGIANAMKVCWTQAKNRVTGSICAVGGMDESEQQSSREEQIKNRLFDADPNPQPRMITPGPGVEARQGLVPPRGPKPQEVQQVQPGSVEAQEEVAATLPNAVVAKPEKEETRPSMQPQVQQVTNGATPAAVFPSKQKLVKAQGATQAVGRPPKVVTQGQATQNPPAPKTPQAGPIK